MKERWNMWRERMYTLLRRSEKYTKTDMVYLAKGGFWFSFGHVISVALTFITALVFANKVAPDVYGTYKYVISIFGIFSVTCLTGMGNLVTQAVARGYEGSLYPALFTKIRWGVLGALGSLGFAIYYYANGNLPLALVFLFGALLVAVMDPFNIFQDYLQGKKRFDLAIPYFSISQVIATIVILATAILTNNLVAIVAAYLVSWTGMRLFFLIRTVRKLPPNDKIDSNTISYGKHMSYIDIIATIIGSLDSAIIFHFLGPVPLAIFSFAIAPVNQLTAIFKIIPNIAMPKQAARSVQEIHAQFHKRLLIAFLISAVIYAAFYFVAPYFFMLFFPKYLSAVPYSRVFGLIVFLTIPNTVIEPAITAKITHLSRRMLYLMNIAGILSTAFVLIFIRELGIMSVVYSRIIYMIIGSSIGYGMWTYIVRKDRRNYSDRDPLTSDMIE